MKHATAALVAIVCLALGALPAHADDSDVKAGPRVTIEPNVVLPLGDFADVAGLGFGMTAAFRMPLNANLGISGRTGILYHLPKNDVNNLQLPLLGGVSYGFKPKVTTPYIGLEFGIAYGRQSGDGVPETVSGTNFAGTIGGGYRTSFADLRAGLQVYDFGNFGDSLGLFATVAFRIAKF